MFRKLIKTIEENKSWGIYGGTLAGFPIGFGAFAVFLGTKQTCYQMQYNLAHASDFNCTVTQLANACNEIFCGAISNYVSQACSPDNLASLNAAAFKYGAEQFRGNDTALLMSIPFIGLMAGSVAGLTMGILCNKICKRQHNNPNLSQSSLDEEQSHFAYHALEGGDYYSQSQRVVPQKMSVRIDREPDAKETPPQTIPNRNQLFSFYGNGKSKIMDNGDLRHAANRRSHHVNRTQDDSSVAIEMAILRKAGVRP